MQISDLGGLIGCLHLPLNPPKLFVPINHIIQGASIALSSLLSHVTNLPIHGELDLAQTGRQSTQQQFEERRLANAVPTDYRESLARIHHKIDARK